MSLLGIYIHVPFCVRKCRYCDFYSVSCSLDRIDKYVDAVCRNIRRYCDISRTVDTVYFGGGTPSLLSDEQIKRILSVIGESFSLDKNAEITLEANPTTVDITKLKKLRNTGINRLSIGVQSMIDKELEFLGRLHDANTAVKAVTDAAEVGFENISCDLMISLPGQTIESLKYSIEGMAKLPIQHISAYILKIESGTPFDSEEIRDMLPDDDESADLYLAMVDMLRSHGFGQYEISNFAKEGYESRHNCRYWRCEDYLGIGPAAHSCYNGKRFAVERDLEKFILSDRQPVYITDEHPCGFEERVMLALRLREGFDLRETGDKRASIEKKLPSLISSGYIIFDGNKISLTPSGYLISNSIITHLIYN